MASIDARALLTPEAVRARAHVLLALARQDALPHFTFHEEHMDRAAADVADTIVARYPALTVPFHARWRHFVFNGKDYWAQLRAGLPGNAMARLRASFDIAITSVLLDAGAGPHWSYRDTRSGASFARSEGLALASLDAIAAGLFADDGVSLRADGNALSRLQTAALGKAFQVSDANPLDGLEGRAALLRALGSAILQHDAFAGARGRRAGHLADHIVARHRDGVIPARAILVAVLDALGPIWPGRPVLQGVPLGDTWRHPAIVTDDVTTGLIPFHKLSQWLSYSLIEPLQDAGFRVTGIGALTGLAEYRNGGLFVDHGVLQPRDAALRDTLHRPDSVFIVEWRGLSVALLDEIAPLVRARLGVSEDDMPLASILEGGTWAAGRKIAAQKRPDGSPPIRILADGTLF